MHRKPRAGVYPGPGVTVDACDESGAPLRQGLQSSAATTTGVVSPAIPPLPTPAAGPAGTATPREPEPVIISDR